MGERICKTCRFAEWQRDPNGGVRRKIAGRCRYDFGEPPVLPVSVPGFRRRWPPLTNGVWPDNDKECPTHEPIEGT